MPKTTDIKIKSVTTYFLPVQTRIPYRFGTEQLDSVHLRKSFASTSKTSAATPLAAGEKHP